MCDMATAETNDDPAATEKARDELQDAVPKAAATLTDLLDADDERIQIRAAEAILDRAGLSKAKAINSRTAQREIGGGDTKDDDSLMF
jgi:vacuolar-type H+-ATPase subunit H